MEQDWQAAHPSSFDPDAGPNVGAEKRNNNRKHLVQQILQIAVDVEVMRPGHLNNRVDYCAGICSLDTVTEQPVLFLMLLST